MSTFFEVIAIIALLMIIYLGIKRLNLPSQYLSGGCGISKKHQDLLLESMRDCNDKSGNKDTY